MAGSLLINYTLYLIRCGLQQLSSAQAAAKCRVQVQSLAGKLCTSAHAHCVHSCNKTTSGIMHG